VSPPSHYREEARQFRDFLRRAASGRVGEVLHLGCGAGHVDSQLKRFVRITGVDLSPAMLRLARRLNPDVTYRPGDMRSVRLGRTFDGVLISDAVAYMRTPGDLARAFATAYRHLRAGGAFVTYGEHIKERFEQNFTKAIHGRKGSVEVVFVENLFDPNPNDTTIEATFLSLIRRHGRLSVETDHHLLGLFPIATWRKSLRDAGFEVRHAGPDSSAPEGDEMPWFVGRKPA
jgi:SAM-dependent methyltransferase